LQTPFCTPECAKTHLQQSRISKFSGGGPPDPLFKGRGGRGRIGKGGEGREGTGEGRTEVWGGIGGCGEGGALDIGSAPIETSSGSAPQRNSVCRRTYRSCHYVPPFHSRVFRRRQPDRTMCPRPPCRQTVSARSFVRSFVLRLNYTDNKLRAICCRVEINRTRPAERPAVTATSTERCANSRTQIHKRTRGRTVD